jgi:proline iminopeptidase
VREGYLPVDNAELYYREIGRDQPLVILHGGPDFDHTYLLPEMDRLADAYRLIYYDQRGRGKSADGVQPADVSLRSEIADLEALREYFRLESVAVLGHSWGGLLAMEYAIRHPGRVSHMLLLNTGPASHDDYLLFRDERGRSAAADVAELKTRSSDPTYREGDPNAVAEYYRVHFRATLRHPEHLERMVGRMRASFTPAGVLKARAIEGRLMGETWHSNGFTLVPELMRLSIPTLVIHGDYDLIPIECAAHIAQAIPGARCVVLEECGHFAYLERPDAVRREIDAFFHGAEAGDVSQRQPG